MKKSLATFLTVIFVIAIAVSLVLVVKHIAEEPSGTISDISEQDADENSEDISSEDNSSQPEESIPKQDTVISFLACPDNIIHPSAYYDAIIRAAEKNGTEPVYKPLETAVYDFESIYEYVASDVALADIAYVNVETMIGGNENGISGYPTFNTPEAAGEVLWGLGFDIYNLAHNHMLDSYNDKYLINCNDFFADKGGTVIGYYKNEADTENIKFIEREGIKIALLAYTYGTNGIPLPSDSETYIPYFNEALIRKQVEIAKQKSDLVIVSAHWGNEDTYNPNSHQRTYAQLFVELGVDVVIGMHPHVIQPMSWEENQDGDKTLLVYSLGNFISGMQDGFNMLGGMLGFDIIKDAESDAVSVDNVVFNPIVTHYTKPGRGINAHDTGHRDYKIYHLEDYTEELALKHGAKIWDRSHPYTLVGGEFSKENLLKTVKKYIPAEFLTDYYLD